MNKNTLIGIIVALAVIITAVLIYFFIIKKTSAITTSTSSSTPTSSSSTTLPSTTSSSTLPPSTPPSTPPPPTTSTSTPPSTPPSSSQYITEQVYNPTNLADVQLKYQCPSGTCTTTINQAGYTSITVLQNSTVNVYVPTSSGYKYCYSYTATDYVYNLDGTELIDCATNTTTAPPGYIYVEVTDNDYQINNVELKYQCPSGTCTTILNGSNPSQFYAKIIAANNSSVDVYVQTSSGYTYCYSFTASNNSLFYSSNGYQSVTLDSTKLNQCAGITAPPPQSDEVLYILNPVINPGGAMFFQLFSIINPNYGTLPVAVTEITNVSNPKISLPAPVTIGNTGPNGIGYTGVPVSFTATANGYTGNGATVCIAPSVFQENNSNVTPSPGTYQMNFSYSLWSETINIPFKQANVTCGSLPTNVNLNNVNWTCSGQYNLQGLVQKTCYGWNIPTS